MAKREGSVQIPTDHRTYCVLLLSLLNWLQGMLTCLPFSARAPEMLEPEGISSSRYHQLSQILQQDKKRGGQHSTASIRTCVCPTLGLEHVVEQLLL